MAVREGMMLSGRYEILSKIGTGGMSDVYKAIDHTLNRFVALKVLKNEFAENSSFVTKFRAEAQAAAGLIHPNIVNVYDVGNEEGLYYIVMELVEGITLKHYIEKKLRLSVKESISIAIQVSMGLECAHRANIIHRDVKPQNIMISKEGKVKVTDFGIARAATSDTITSNVMGSVHYTSPEQARGGYSDEKSDIYSLGIVLFEMLTGRVPFDGDTTVSIAIQHIQDTVPSPRNFVNDIPKSVEQIIFKCCEKSPDRRYMSMTELIADLKQSLLTPDDDFVKLIPSGGFAGGATQVVTEDDMKTIKSRTGNIDIDESLLSVYNRNRAHSQDEMPYDDPSYPQNGGYDDNYRDEYDNGYGNDYGNGYGNYSYRDDEMELENILDNSRAYRENARARSDRSAHPSGRRGAEATDQSRPAYDDRRKPDYRKTASKRNDDLKKARELDARRRRAEEDDDDDMDPMMQKIMRIMAVVIGIVLLIVVIVVVRKVTGPLSSASESDNTTAEDSVVTVEDVSGQTFEAARTRLTGLGFKVESQNLASDTVPSGSVISQTPVAGTQLPAGSTITLVVSSGSGSITVPDVMGLTLGEAKVKIESMGLMFNNQSGTTDGVVTSQEPAGNTFAEPGSIVNVVISTGQEEPAPAQTEEPESQTEQKVEVPNLVGLAQKAADTAITAKNLRTGTVNDENSDTVPLGVIISQDPAPGSMVDAQTAISYVVSLGPAAQNVTPTPVSNTYKCNLSVTAPSDYTGGRAVVILKGDTTGTEYFKQAVEGFPVSIKLSGLLDPSGKVVVTHEKSETMDDGTVVTTEKTQEAAVTFEAE
ncbi:MAG: Stk1 family PASTA domain-containing Ser/Thr kinase [Lachnospiraceae bacterium]|nr:Stk1 family PASTA domain-containing Ser/Thr kinase [Lachnospiraceae bacterium]